MPSQARKARWEATALGVAPCPKPPLPGTFPPPGALGGPHARTLHSFQKEGGPRRHQPDRPLAARPQPGERPTHPLSPRPPLAAASAGTAPIVPALQMRKPSPGEAEPLARGLPAGNRRPGERGAGGGGEGHPVRHARLPRPHGAQGSRRGREPGRLNAAADFSSSPSSVGRLSSQRWGRARPGSNPGTKARSPGAGPGAVPTRSCVTAGVGPRLA